MKYIKFIILGIAAFAFTGCSFHTPINYDNKYAKSEFKDFHKIDKMIVVNDSYNEDLVHIRSDLITKFVTTTNKDFSKKITRDFLAQYFKNVSISNRTGYFNFEIIPTKIDNVELGNSPEFFVEFLVVVTKEGKVILKKTYNRLVVAPNVLWNHKYLGIKELSNVYSNQTVHLGFHEMLEEQVKPDLLKALTENP